MHNKSGIYPIRNLVLVLPDEDTKSDIIAIPDNLSAREQLSQIFGTLVAVGATAWSYEDDKYQADHRKRLIPGTRVMFAKYHGIVHKGLDGKHYRLITDEDVTAIVEPDLKKEVGA